MSFLFLKKLKSKRNDEVIPKKNYFTKETNIQKAKIIIIKPEILFIHNKIFLSFKIFLLKIFTLLLRNNHQRTEPKNIPKINEKREK